jgi:hypothetical protein
LRIQSEYIKFYKSMINSFALVYLSVELYNNIVTGELIKRNIEYAGCFKNKCNLYKLERFSRFNDLKRLSRYNRYHGNQ